LSIQNFSGQSLGQYQLRELLGVGGMGAVYRAYQVNLERFVAVKVLSASLVTDNDYIQRFNREAKTSASLEHPHIVAVYDYGVENGVTYVVMRMLAGGSLAERLQHSRDTGRPLPSLEETVAILRQLASALDYAHARGVIHRDIKTSNVMFDEQGTAFLVDFGIAKLMSATSGLTGTGMALGTPSYMAPEQWRGDVLTPAADQYALGILTYNTLTGHLPFEADTPFALMHKHLNEEPTPLTVFRPDLPEATRNVLKRAIAKDPADRYPSMTTFAESFAASINGVQSQPTGFFVTPLPQKQLLQVIPPVKVSSSGMMDGPTITPTPGSSLPAYTSSAKPATMPTELLAKKGQNPLVWIVALIVLLVVGGGIFLLSEVGGEDEVSLTETAQRIAQVAGTETAIAAATDTPTRTTTPTRTPTPSPTRTPSPTNTLAPRALAQITRGAILTQTATAWTATPTPNITQTLRAELTSLYDEDLTATATLWTPTATNTPTPTKTPSRTPTFTVTPSATSTITPSPTEIPTITPSATSTITPSPTTTPTVTPSATRTITPSPTSSPTSTVTPSPTTLSSATPDLEATANFRVTEVIRNVTATARALADRATPTANLPPTPPPLINCEGAPPSRLFAGSEGFVLDDDRRPVNVRSGPGTNNPRIDQIQVNERFSVVEGPRCNEGYTWYRISYGGGVLEGWIAEGDSEVYYVAPRPGESRSSGNQPPPPGENIAPNCDVIVQDDFETNTTQNDWFLGRGNRSIVRIERGAYEIALGQTPGSEEAVSWGSLRGVDFTDASIGAVIRSPSFSDETSRMGLWLRYQGENGFLAFMIRGDGAYRIARWDGEIYIDLVAWENTDALQTGNNAPNTLRIDSFGSQFDLYINGTFINSVEDNTWASGRAAFWGASEITPIVFRMDLFRACQN